jgi:hypothetical protein
MTQRDWQKDMEMCGHHVQPLVFAYEARYALPYWLQEAKVYKQSYEGTLTAWEAEKARADAAESRIKKLESELNSKKQLLRETDQSRTEVREMYRSVCDVAQEYKDNLKLVEAREQRLKEAVETIKELSKWDGISVYLDRCYIEARDVLSTLYPDTPAQPAATVPEITARPIDEWGEDYGDVLWWTFPIEESPYCGSPLDSDWPDYHTHWTPLVIPEAPAPKEGE